MPPNVATSSRGLGLNSDHVIYSVQYDGDTGRAGFIVAIGEKSLVLCLCNRVVGLQGNEFQRYSYTSIWIKKMKMRI